MTMISNDLDNLEASIAEAAATLMKLTLQAARLRADDPDITSMIDGLTAARLIVTGAGPQLQLELLADVNGGTVRFFGATFVEPSSVLQ